VKRLAHLVTALYRGCGVCGAACPSGAILVNLFEEERILAQTKAFVAQQHRREANPIQIQSGLLPYLLSNLKGVESPDGRRYE
jgi:ferredoxin